MGKLIDKFTRESGFKVLAMARLSQIEYSIALYLINCAASNLNEVITTEVELSSLIGYGEKEVRKALDTLATRNMIKLKYGTPHSNPDKDSVRIGMQFDLTSWKFDFQSDVNAKDAIVFPFRRSGETHLQIVNNDAMTSGDKKGNKEATWIRVLEAFRETGLDEDDVAANETSAKVLVETHPVDQVLLMVRHFRMRIPTLSLLASSWQHFQELYEEETAKVDILDARHKHLELDDKIRAAATDFLVNAEEGKLSEEERTVLDILSKHRHPRRQLFWAYQMRSRYPNMAEFFTAHASMMLSVTSSGKVVPRKDP